MTKVNYFIKENYKCNPPHSISQNFYSDSVNNSESYQIDVYKKAAEIIIKNNLVSCLDIGCGYGRKLIKYIYSVCKDITGIDEKHAITYCKTNHSVGNWIEQDIEKQVNLLNRKFDLILSADVIEHLIDPDKLITLVKKYAHGDSFIVISTPERDYRRGFKDTGPPENKYHIREWNQKELKKYLEYHGLQVLEQHMVKDAERNFKSLLKFSLKKPLLFANLNKFCQVSIAKLTVNNDYD